MNIKNTLLLLSVVAATYGLLHQQHAVSFQKTGTTTAGSSAPGRAASADQFSAESDDKSSAAVDRAFESREQNAPVAGEGRVAKVLADDAEGSRHQKFLLRLPSGLTILIAHNIDLAPRIEDLKAGDTVEFIGDYEWNAKGGVVHWTHRDPAGRHVSGWLKHNGRLYQ